MTLRNKKAINRINEVGRTAKMFGDVGAAQLKQFANRWLPGGDRAEGQLSVIDKAHKEKFINNLFSAAFKSLQSEIAAGRVDPNIKSTQFPTKKQPTTPPQVTETKYQKLNTLFERIVLTEAESVEQWFKRFLPTYLRGIPISDTTTQDLIKIAADSYDPKNIGPFKQALLKLANAIFATAQAPGYGKTAPTNTPSRPVRTPTNTPSRAVQATKNNRRPLKVISRPVPTSHGMAANKDEIINNLQNMLEKLRGTDTTTYNDVIKKIVAGQPLTATSTTSTVVSETRRM